MKPLILAVISDLHVGLGARARDLCPHADSKAVETGYKDKFLRFVRKKSLRADYLIVSGDISHKAQPDEFELASTLISEIAAALGVASEHILFVPGNHDVDWAELGISDSTGFRRAQRYGPLRHDPWIFKRIMQSGKPDILEPPYFSLWEYEDLVALGYNSAWHDDPEIVVHHGLVSNEHIEELDKLLSRVDLSPSRLRAFIVHHHPIQYSDPLPELPDFSAMTNSPRLLEVLQKYNFDLIIHGHKHCPQFGTYIINAGFPIAILGSGSFSATLDPRWSGYVNNQFHLVKIEGRDVDHQCVYGLLESWTYLCGHSWQPSETTNGIRHEVPFGTYVQLPQLLSTLEPILASRFVTENVVLWSSIVSSIPNLNYLPPERIVEVIDKLSSKIGFRRLGEPPDEVVLLKE